MPLENVQQLIDFVNKRNSSEFSSNLQFSIDCEECGFEPEDLGKPEKMMDGEIPVGYRWITPFGVLTEHFGKLELQPKE